MQGEKPPAGDLSAHPCIIGKFPAMMIQEYDLNRRSTGMAPTAMNG